MLVCACVVCNPGKAGFLVMRPICNSYTMGCPPERGDNPQALSRGLSCVQVDKHRITILYHLHQCRPCTSQDFHGKGGIMLDFLLKCWNYTVIHLIRH